MAAALAFAMAITVISIAGLWLPDYEPNPVVLTILGTLVLALLGLEARDLLRPNGGDR